MEKIIAYAAGRANGNPGPAAVGVYVTDESGAVVTEAKLSIGNSNDNYAEYHGVLLALQTLQEHYGQVTADMAFEIRLDSEFVYKQLKHVAPVTHPGLVPMFVEIHNMRVASFPQLTVVLVPEGENKEAKLLVNEVLDGK